MAKTLVINSGATATSTANTDQYRKIAGGLLTASTTEANQETKFNSAGILSNLWVKVTANSVAATSTFSLRKNNGTDLNNTIPITASTPGSYEDATNTDTISATDRVSMKTHPGAASGTYSISMVSLLFDATTDTVTKLSFSTGNSGFATASLSTFQPFSGTTTGAPANLGSLTTEANCKCRMRKAGILKNLGVLVTTVRATDTIARSRKNGANGNLFLTITGGGAAGWWEDTVNSDTIGAGEDWNTTIIHGTGTSIGVYEAVTTEFISTNGDGLCVLGKGSGTSIADAAARCFASGGFYDDTTANEALTQIKARAAFVCSELTTLISANDVDSASSCRLRVGAVDVNLVATITASTPGVYSDSSHTDTLGTTSLINTNITVPSVSGSHAVVTRNIILYTHIDVATGTLYTRPLDAETITVGESLAEIYNANRAPAAQTTTISEAIARLATNTRAPTAETITIGESLGKVFGVNRALATETTTIGETLARMFIGTRALSDTTVIGESLARLYAASRVLSDTTVISESLARAFGLVRALSDTSTIGESLARVYNAIRGLSDTTTVSEAIAKVQVLVRTLSDTTAISESLARIIGKIKALSDTTVIGEALARVFTGTRTLTAETNTIAESLARLKGANRSLSDTVTIGESLARILAAIRSLSDTTVISESLARTYNAIRTLSDTSTISELLAKVQTLVRSLSDTTIVSESFARLLAAIRALSDTSTIAGIVDILHTPIGGGAINYVRSLSDTINISENLARLTVIVRSLSVETTVISESLARLKVAIRSLSDTIIVAESLSRLQALIRALSVETTAITESITRIFGVVRSLSQTTVIGESLSRVLGAVRSLSQTTIIAESLARLQVLTRTLTDTTPVTELLARIFGTIRSLSQTTVITESLAKVQALIRELTDTTIVSETLSRLQALTRTLTAEITSISDFVDAIIPALEVILIEFVSISESLVYSVVNFVKGMPLYLQTQGGRKPEGVKQRDGNRGNERESPLYLSKQLALFGRVFSKRRGVGKTRGG